MKKTTLFVITSDEVWYQTLKKQFDESEYHILSQKNKGQVLETFYEYNKDINYIIFAEKYPDYELHKCVETIKNYSDIPVYLLSENMGEDTQMMYYRAGVDDYLPYNYSMELLMMKIQILGRRLYGKNEVIQEGIMEINSFHKKVKIEGVEVKITVKEFELLYYLICHKKVIQTRDQILTAVWGINYMGNDRVVDSLIKKLRNKIGKASSYIKTVYGLGYYFEAIDN